MYELRKGGRSKKANYSTVVMRVPSPIKLEVAKLVEKFHQDNEFYLSLPIDGQWWEVLGVSKDAECDLVKAAYKKLVKLYHPDINPKRDARARMAAINNAYRAYREQLK
ncbi:MAG: DnaJ domain-containing protein [Prochloraceae cyanobacterium]|nr:DnaJ domain-containing protein [Prochloraceae cyanobacterium]